MPKYTFYCFILLFTFSSPCATAVQVITVLIMIQVYNWEIRHHSSVRRCGLADVLYNKVDVDVDVE